MTTMHGQLLHKGCHPYAQADPATMLFDTLQKYYSDKDVYFWRAFNLVLPSVNLRYDTNDTNSWL